jgi:hypothetical protein
VGLGIATQQEVKIKEHDLENDSNALDDGDIF